MSTALATQSLYAIEEHLQALVDTAEMAPPEQQAEIQQAIADYLALERSKVDRVAQFLAVCEAGIKTRKDEAKRLTDEAKAIQAAQERLEQYVCKIIEQRGVKKLEGAANVLSVRPSDAVVITDARKVPLDLQKVTVKMNLRLWVSVACEMSEDLLGAVARAAIVETDPLTGNIKQCIKAGEEVPGADLEFRSNLQRK